MVHYRSNLRHKLTTHTHARIIYNIKLFYYTVINNIEFNKKNTLAP